MEAESMVRAPLDAVEEFCLDVT